MAAFPNRVIKAGEADRNVVSAIQQALSDQGYGPFTAGSFDASMTSIVKLFQAQHTDADGMPLEVDGEVGIFTWGALFDTSRVSPSTESSPLMLQALGLAGSQVGQMEVPEGSNRGPMVDKYLASVSIDPAATSADERAWCMAFVYWCFDASAKALDTANPLPKTAGCIDHWTLAGRSANATRIKAADAYADRSLIKPGLIFVLDFGGGHGHTGVVERLLDGGRLQTVEGNTNNDGSRNGVGVFRLNRRKLNDATLKGYIDYSA
jgi:CHAP domain-containing protein/putative peptidoglycan binding protein